MKTMLKDKDNQRGRGKVHHTRQLLRPLSPHHRLFIGIYGPSMGLIPPADQTEAEG